MCDQEVESCDCVDEETECTGARVRGGGYSRCWLSVADDSSEQFAISVITDANESCQTLTLVSQFYRFLQKCFVAISVVCRSKSPPSWSYASQLVDDWTAWNTSCRASSGFCACRSVRGNDWQVWLCIGAYESTQKRASVRVQYVWSRVCAARQLTEAHVSSHWRASSQVHQVLAMFLRRVGTATSLRRHPRPRRALRLRHLWQAIPAHVVGADAPHAARRREATSLWHVWQVVHSSVWLAAPHPCSPARSCQGGGRRGHQGGRAETRGIHRLSHRVAAVCCLYILMSLLVGISHTWYMIGRGRLDK